MKPINALSRRAASAIMLAIALFASRPASAEFGPAPGVVYPELPAAAVSADGFLPSGWAIEKVVKGDLNGDRLPDMVILFRQASPANRLTDPESPEREPLDTNPRLIAVTTARPGGAGYGLHTVNFDLIPRHEDPNMTDPFVDLTVDRGSMRVMLESFQTAGSWYSSSVTFVLRLAGTGMSLIGYERSDLNRGSGDFTEVSINYLSGRKQTSTGNVSSDRKVSKWVQLPKRPPINLIDIGNGLDFDPLNP